MALCGTRRGRARGTAIPDAASRDPPPGNHVGTLSRRRHEIAAIGLLHPEYREIQFSIEPIDPSLSIDADPQLLASPVMNLLHNAFKNRPSGGSVVLRATAEQGQLLIEIEDECGGIPPGKGDLFQVFGNEAVPQAVL